MVATISVSYGLLAGYVGFVVVSTLLVGILPPLVNLPECKDTRNLVDDDFKVENNLAEEELPHQHQQTDLLRQKRY